jgi:hypothetical protein
MANLSVPNNYTFSPSSATHLTINHDVAAELDSTYAFEGKLPPSAFNCTLSIQGIRY